MIQFAGIAPKSVSLLAHFREWTVPRFLFHKKTKFIRYALVPIRNPASNIGKSKQEFRNQLSLDGRG